MSIGSAGRLRQNEVTASTAQAKTRNTMGQNTVVGRDSHHRSSPIGHKVTPTASPRRLLSGSSPGPRANRGNSLKNAMSRTPSSTDRIPCRSHRLSSRSEPLLLQPPVAFPRSSPLQLHRHPSRAWQRGQASPRKISDHRFDRPLCKPDGRRSPRAGPKRPPFPSRLSRIGSMPPCVPASPPSKPLKSPRRRPWLRPLLARGGRRGCALRFSTALIRRVMTRGRCGSSGRASSAGRRTRGGFVTIRKPSETLGFSRKKYKRQAETSESSGKSGLTGSQEESAPRSAASPDGPGAKLDSAEPSWSLAAPLRWLAIGGLGNQGRPGRGRTAKPRRFLADRMRLRPG